MRVEDLRPIGIFTGLTDDQLAELIDHGAEVGIEPGHDLFREGDPADSWWLLVDGAVDLIRHVGREDTVVARMNEPGRWAGGFRAWDEHGVYLATGRGVAPGRLLRVPATALRACFDSWFPFGGHLVAGVYRTARSVESAARQRGALVTLGTLAAGLAHELNNPAAAATRAVAALEGESANLLESLRRLADQEISPAQFAALDGLRRGIEPPGELLDPLARSEREQALAEWLDAHAVERGWVMAPALAAAGVDAEWCDRAAAVLDGGALQPGLTWVTSTLSVTALLSEVKESTRRISELVSAVRSYSQLDRGAMQQVDVRDGIESTLVMLGHKLRGDVTVEREYSTEVPLIEAYEGELNQVWTNVIDNAVDAMEGAGTLRVGVRLAGADVVVEIGDTGPGMTPE
ncbi:MAG: ATP-binding protein, partial [Nocardioidaceae bacterium]